MIDRLLTNSWKWLNKVERKTVKSRYIVYSSKELPEKISRLLLILSYGFIFKQCCLCSISDICLILGISVSSSLFGQQAQSNCIFYTPQDRNDVLVFHTNSYTVIDWNLVNSPNYIFIYALFFQSHILLKYQFNWWTQKNRHIINFQFNWKSKKINIEA